MGSEMCIRDRARAVRVSISGALPMCCGVLLMGMGARWGIWRGGGWKCLDAVVCVWILWFSAYAAAAAAAAAAGDVRCECSGQSVSLASRVHAVL